MRKVRKVSREVYTLEYLNAAGHWTLAGAYAKLKDAEYMAGCLASIVQQSRIRTWEGSIEIVALNLT